MADNVYGRVFDSSTSGWIADLIISKEIAQFDSSIAELWEYEAIQDVSILSIGDGFLKESSLGTDFVWNAGLLDVSIQATDASVAELYDFYEDLSAYTYSHTHAQDASIAEIYNEIENLPQDVSIVDLYNYTLDLSTRLDNFEPAQDASISDLYSKKADKTEIYSKSYIDGSLNTKQPLGNYVKEASLGDGLFWVDGELDVSVASGVSSLSSLTDVSIVSVSEGDALMYTSEKWKNIPTSDIADVLVDISTIMVDFTTIAYTKTQTDASFALKTEVIVKGASNIEQAGMDASILKGIDASGNLLFKKIGGTGAIDIVEHDDYIDINIDASFSGEINTASNLGDGIGLYKEKVLEDLKFKSIKSNSAEIVISSSDNEIYIDASIDYSSTLAGLSDVSITDVSSGNALMYDENVWKNIPTLDIADVLVDISTIMVEATSVFYTKTQVDASFASISHTHDQDASIANLYSLIQGSFSGTFTSDGSTITIENGLITGIV